MGKSHPPPRCADCKRPHARWVPVGYEHVWLCADCEYARRHGNAVLDSVRMPWERPPAPRQRERLF